MIILLWIYVISFIITICWFIVYHDDFQCTRNKVEHWYYVVAFMSSIVPVLNSWMAFKGIINFIEDYDDKGIK